MPPAALAIPAIIGAVGSTASGAQGKKNANNLAQQQLALQNSQFNLEKRQYGLGNAAFTPAFNYWNALLKGGNAATQAVGPIAGQIGQVAQGARNSITALTPRGGEQNLGIANSFNQQAGNIAGLYAGVQPAAASGLGQLAGTAFGSGAAVNPFANVGAAAGLYGQQQQLAAQGAGGAGQKLYSALRQPTGGKGGGGGGGGKNPTGNAPV